MVGFKTFVPAKGRRGGIHLSTTALYLGSDVAAQLPKADSYDLGHDGHRRFILVPAEGRPGFVKVTTLKGSNARRCASKQIVRFIREKLRAPEEGSITLSYKMVDGVLMFGILDKEVRA